MYKVRVTSLNDWLRCKLLWRYKHHDLFSLRPGNEELGPRTSGTAVHAGVEAGLLRAPGRDALEAASEGASLHLATIEKGQKYEKGALRALAGVPNFFWNIAEPQAEQAFETFYASHKVTITGHPDLWYLSDGGITVCDFKSTSDKVWDRLESYQIWNMQPRYYAVLIHDWLIEQGKIPPPFYTQHVVLCTQGKPAVGAELLLSPKEMDFARTRLLRFASQMTHAHDAPPTELEGIYDGLCQRCDMAPVCTTYLTGGSTESILKERYTKEE